MNKYTYEGPVMEFDICVTSLWKAETFAVSESKAKSNLTYRYKKENNKLVNTKITLPEKLIIK
ncbi:hypothetical protein FACS1894132_04830 [Clostridia bacterium]|nr:hypothetical protein FACS1894132_04830 [Clostridia bacterium]